MHWFHETQQMGWLVMFWIASAVFLALGGWLFTMSTKGAQLKPPSGASPSEHPGDEGHHLPS